MKRNRKYSTRYCPDCGCKLVRNGHYANGKIRLYCKNCKRSHSFNKNAVKALKTYHWEKRYKTYLCSKNSIKDLEIPRNTFWRNTKNFGYENVTVYPHPDKVKCIALDGTWTGNSCYLIATGTLEESNVQIPLVSMKTEIEKYATWKEVIKLLPKCDYFICDAQKGLLKAIQELRPEAKIQICIFHIWKTIRKKLTLNPETGAGKLLLQIARFLLSKVKEGKELDLETKIFLFKNWLEDWHDRFKDFISEKTITQDGKHWFYTHKNVRSAYRTLKKHLDNHFLFQFATSKNVPRTNNGIEGGINSQIKRLIWMHRGSTYRTRNNLIMVYLEHRSIATKKLWCS